MTESKNNVLEVGREPELFRVTVTRQSGETIYDESSCAGIVVTAENAKIQQGGSVEGTTQRYFWGHPVVWLFCVDQLRRHLRDAMPVVIDEILEKMEKFGISERERKCIKAIAEKCRANLGDCEECGAAPGHCYSHCKANE